MKLSAFIDPNYFGFCRPSSRNSEVIHGGKHYPTGTLRARATAKLCAPNIVRMKRGIGLPSLEIAATQGHLPYSNHCQRPHPLIGWKPPVVSPALVVTWGHHMTTADVGGRVAFLERQVGSRKAGEILNLENRIDLAERLVDQHGLDIMQYRQEATNKSAVLEARIRGLEQLVVFLAEVLVALIAVLVAGLVAGYLGGGYWVRSSGLAAIAFLVAFLGANFLFREVVSSCLK